MRNESWEDEERMLQSSRQELMMACSRVVTVEMARSGKMLNMF